MRRRPNTRSTAIYWLVDVRPETLAVHSSGKPFYCGKTVESVTKRIGGHRTAARQFPGRPISVRLNACERHVRIDVVESVPPGSNWRERERFWIATLRFFHPDCVNVSSGGDGVPGLIHSKEARARMSAWQTGLKRGPLSDETRAKIGAANKGRPVSDDTRSKRSFLAKNRTAEHRAKISAANTGRKLSAEHRAKLSAVRKGKPRSPEWRAKISAAHIGKTHSAESRQKMSLAAKARRVRGSE
jgi:hypothetical protein